MSQSSLMTAEEMNNWNSFYWNKLRDTDYWQTLKLLWDGI